MASIRASSSTDHNPLWNHDYEDLYQYEDGYIPMKSGQNKFIFDPTLHPVDEGWVAYIAKDFGNSPSWSRKARHKFAATRETKAMATKIRQNRSKQMDGIVRWMFEDTLANWPDLRRMR